SFEAGVTQLGGSSLFQGGSEGGLGVRETGAGFAPTMSPNVGGIVLRGFEDSTVGGGGKHPAAPGIHGLSGTVPPCQAMADMLTLRECIGDEKGKTIAFVGDGNNVARSLAVLCGKLGVRFVLARPDGYGFPMEFAKNYMAHVSPKMPEEFADPAEA